METKKIVEAFFSNSLIIQNKGNHDRDGVWISDLIIQQIVTISKYGHDALDICHP